MADDSSQRSERKEKKEREDRDKKEKKEKEKKEKSSSGKHRFLGIPNPITSISSSLSHKKDTPKPPGDPHSSYTADPSTPSGDSRGRAPSASGKDFGSLRARSGVLTPEASAASPAPSPVPKLGTPASSPHPPTPGALSESGKAPAQPAQSSDVAPPKRPAELINDHENIQPVPGPLDDPDAPKQKPGETLVSRLMVQATNLGVLIACVLLSWCIGALGMSFVWTILLVIALHKVDWKTKKEGWVRYCPQMIRPRHLISTSYYRAQERKRLHQEALNADFEKMVWLRILLNKAWPVYSNYMITTTRVATSKAIEEMFSKNKPPMVNNVVLDHVDFGNVPPEIHSIKGYVHHQEKDGRIVESNNVFQMDANVVYKGDFTLTMKVYVRLAPLTPPVPLPITVNGISFEGRARIVTTLLPQEPFVESVEFAFVTMPKVGFKVTPIGAVDVMSISSLEAMVQTSIDDVMKGMLVLPNRFIYRMPGAPEGTVRSVDGSVSANAAQSLVKLGKAATKSTFVKPAVKRTLGTLKVEAIEARNLKAMDANGKSDPFLKLKVGETKKKTKIIEKNLNPKWNESFEFNVTNEYPKELRFSCFDYDKGINSNDLIGEGSYDFSELSPEVPLDNWVSMGAQLGDIRLRLTWYPDPSA